MGHVVDVTAPESIPAQPVVTDEDVYAAYPLLDRLLTDLDASALRRDVEGTLRQIIEAVAPTIIARNTATLEARLARVSALLEQPSPPRFDSRTGSFTGLVRGPEDAHRTVGPHRAWSDSSEWCYPDMPCRLCSEPIDQADLRAALAGVDTTQGEGAER